MKVFVTGGTGFVGSHTVQALQARGHDVICLARDPERARRQLAPRVPELIAGDMADRAALARGCSQAEAVVHLAGLTAARSRAELFAVNARGSAALVEALREAGPGVRRLVLVSSLSAAGPVARGGVLLGSEEAKPVSDYGRSKLAGEEALRGLELDWTILRPPAVYGPRDREFLRLFRAARGGWAPVFGDGGQELSLVYAGDLAEAIARCLEAPPPRGVYYPAHPEVVTARMLAESIARAVAGRSRVVPIPRAVVRPMLWISGGAARAFGRATLLGPDKASEILASAWTCSPERLETHTGWKALVPLTAGISRTVDWYRETGWL